MRAGQRKAAKRRQASTHVDLMSHFANVLTGTKFRHVPRSIDLTWQKNQLATFVKLAQWRGAHRAYGTMGRSHHSGHQSQNPRGSMCQMALTMRVPNCRNHGPLIVGLTRPFSFSIVKLII